MLFITRMKAEKEFEEYCKHMGLKNCCSSVLVWLEGSGEKWLKELNPNKTITDCEWEMHIDNLYRTGLLKEE